jgi:hypothetical protein
MKVPGTRSVSDGQRPAAYHPRVMGTVAESTIRARLRSLIDEGTLPHTEPKHSWSSMSPGPGRCGACGVALTEGELEYELTTAAAAVIFRFHPQCFTLYASVVAERRRDGGITSPP